MRLLSDNRGTVMMEYAMLTAMVAIPFFLVWHGASIPWFGGENLELPGLFDFTTGQYIGTGLEIQKFFQQLQGAIALPLP